MGIKSGFFNSVNGDRRYLADFFALFFGTLIGNGVFPNPSTGLQVLANRDMSVSIRLGKAWINGYFFVNDTDYILQLDVADGALKRIDRVVLRLDYLERQIIPVIKKGALSSSPVAPNLQRDADAYEIALADIMVNNGTIIISQANITDLRLNTDFCGIVTSTIDQVDTTTIFNQYQSWFESFTNDSRQVFDDWFATIQDILDDNAAGNLLEIITSHKEDYTQHPGIATATNLGNNYSVTLNPPPTSYVEGMGIVVKINSSSNGATSINVNGLGTKPILKGSGNTVKNLYAGGIYTLRYNADALNGTGAFILQGEGGEYGNATANQVMKGYTIGTDDGVFEGTIENRGSLGTITPSTASKNYAAGFYNAFSVLGSPDLIAQNIRSGKNIFGVSGSFVGKDYAKGSAMSQIVGSFNGAITVNNLAFRPKFIFITPAQSALDATNLQAELTVYIDPSEYFPLKLHSNLSINNIIGRAYMNSYGKHLNFFTTTTRDTVNPYAIINSNGFEIGGIVASRLYNWVAFG